MTCNEGLDVILVNNEDAADVSTRALIQCEHSDFQQYTQVAIRDMFD